MANLTTEDLADLALAARRNLPKLKFENLAADIQKYYGLPHILREENVTFAGGRGCEFEIMKTDSGQAKRTGPYDEDTIRILDVLAKGFVPWKYYTVPFGIDLFEAAENSGPEQIVNLYRLRRIDALMSLTKLLEQDLWSKPTDSTVDDQLFGLFYWIVFNSSKGFNGGNPGGFSTCANIDASTVTQYANYTDTYVEISEGDAIPMLKEAHYKTDWEGPVESPTYQRGKTDQVFYTNYDVRAEFESLVLNRNDNVGKDLGIYMGQTMMKGAPIIAVPQLDKDKTDATALATAYPDPILMVDWSVLQPIILKKVFMNESKPKEVGKQHTTVAAHIDLGINTKCENRRKLAGMYRVSG